jgi:DMSO/TMAO reductase YedYZ molybdopterin-dependent catalytic subunit
VFGLVEEEKRWTWAEFNQLPRRKVKMDIHCVTRWSKFDTEWEGISVKDMVDQGIIRLKPGARFVMQHCEYGFTVNIPLSVALSDVFLLAIHYNGQPLEPDHGYPLRGVAGALPGQRGDNDRYLWKGGKWLRALEFMAEDRPGFWEQAGYSMSAKVWEEERYE